MLDEYNFSSDFQDAVLACLVEHYDKFAAYGDIIKPEYFWGPIAAQTCEALQAYQKKYNRFPGFTALGDFVYSRTKGEGEREATAAIEYVQKLAKIDTKDWRYVLDRCSNFARERALNNAIQESYTLLSEGKIPEEGFAPKFADAMRVGQNMAELGYVMVTDSDAVIEKITSVTYGIKSGFPVFDECWPNGWAPGWLIVPLAPPKRFKSSFVINLALNAVTEKENQHVFFYACELSSELMLARAYANLTGLTLRVMYNDKEDFKKLAKKALSEKVKSHLIAQHYPAKTASIVDVRNHALRARDTFGIEPKLIVIDHAETMRPRRANKGDRQQSDWREQADIYTEARALGDELQCTIVMPDRCKISTVNKAVPTMVDFQGAFEKAGIVDVGIGLCATEKEIQDGTMRYFVFLNRHGEAQQLFRGKLDPARVIMTIEEKLKYVPEEDEEETGHNEQRAAFRKKKGDRRPLIDPNKLLDER